jgi:hypothetical protein
MKQEAKSSAYSMITAAIVCGILMLATYFFAVTMTTERLKTEHQEATALATSDAFVRAICLASDQLVGSCEATISASGQEYIVKGGVVLQTNGDLAATPAVLPKACSGADNAKEPLDPWGISETSAVCQVTFPKTEAEASSAETPAVE